MLEKALEEFLVRVIRRALTESITGAATVGLAQREAVAEIPQEQPAKRTRKKAEQILEQKGDATLTGTEAAVVGQAIREAAKEAVPPVVDVDPFAAFSGQAAPAAIALPKAERKQVTAALITVAKNPALGPSVAHKLLADVGVKEVKDLKEEQYIEVVKGAATALGIELKAALELNPVL